VLGEAALLRGDVQWVNRELNDLQAVSAADVQRVLKRDVLRGARVTVLYEAEAAPARKKVGKP